MTEKQPTLEERVAEHIKSFEKHIEDGCAGYYVSIERMIDLVEYYHIKQDSIRLREYLDVTPIDIKRIEGIVPTVKIE